MNGETLLKEFYYAMSDGDLERAKKLYTKGVDIFGDKGFFGLVFNENNFHGRLFNPGISLIKFLIDSGFDPKITDEDGNTFLHLVVKFYSVSNAIPAVKFLIDKGLDIYDENDYGETPLDILKEVYDLENFYELDEDDKLWDLIGYLSDWEYSQLEKPTPSGKPDVTYRASFYSRGNVGSCEFDNEVLANIAQEALDLLNSGCDVNDVYNYIEEVIEKKINKDGIGIKWDDDDSFIIYDKNLDSGGSSWGYDSVTIEPDTYVSRIEQFVSEVERVVKADPNAEWCIADFVSGDWILYPDNLPFDLEDDDVDCLTGKEVLELVKAIANVLYVYKDERNSASTTINDPYGWTEDDFDFNVSSNEIEFTTTYVGNYYSCSSAKKERLILVKK